MAKVTLQVKSIASLIIATAASISWGIAGRRFDGHTQSWPTPAVIGTMALLLQAGLIFVESKEEEELSLTRKGRLASEQQSIAENEKLSTRIQSEIESGNPESAEKWVAFRRDHYGK